MKQYLDILRDLIDAPLKGGFQEGFAGILWSVLSPRVTCKLNKLDFIRELNEKGQTSGGF
jgi:ABC-type polysaccharide/polyol phosphate export permease